ncbi:hypothetical protein [Nafulsella turpanensis]|uniref:hypothetical protein n=1 Tax=Nafulsella turpanensis TaxID=1265690 RepID=UPI001267B295|nr:hypothetical protein [Nafulsella turpanensis]
MSIWLVSLVLLIILMFVVNLTVTRKIILANYQDEERRKAHLIILWVLPVIGVLMTRFYWKKSSPKIKVITKNDRRSNSGRFYDSGHGLYGGGD